VIKLFQNSFCPSCLFLTSKAHDAVLGKPALFTYLLIMKMVSGKAYSKQLGAYLAM
jgi:hypothetical protein